MAEPITTSLATEAVKAVTARAVEEIRLYSGFKDQLEKLKNRLLYIQALLEDLGSKHNEEQSSLVNVWLEEIEDAAFSAENVMDDYAYEMLRRKIELKINNKPSFKKKCRKFITPSTNPIFFRCRMSHRVSEILSMFDELGKKAEKLGLKPADLAANNERPSTYYGDDYHHKEFTYDVGKGSNIIGRKLDEDELLLKLLNVIGNEGNHGLPTIAITGFGVSESSLSYLTDDEIKGSLIGYTAKTIEELYNLYVRHSQLQGFSIRKHTTRRYQNTGVLYEVYYICSAAGTRTEKPKVVTPILAGGIKKKKRKAKQQKITRTNCKAEVRIKLQSDGEFQIIHHVIAHNHPLTRISLQHFHRSERIIGNEKGHVIEALQESGIGAADSFRYLCSEAGGAKFVGHTYVDHMNYTSRMKMKMIEGKDSQTVVNMLIKKGEEEPNFFYRVKLNEEGQVISMYWRDSMMKEDYDVYGDVVVFDTTFRTNKYNLICAPFVGVNNHWSNVMFGCAFIADEKTETFEWLLETFLESMEGKSPVSIFTDQDQAMANAIEKVFPSTRHRLCLWHLQKNAASRFGELKSDETFKDTFKRCLYRCYTTDEFEATWSNMIEEYNLHNHEWFTHLYTLKEKWCTALNKDFFSAGILSSQRSESTNNAIGFKGNKSTTLTEFFHIFSATVDRWRYQEDQNEFDCEISLPKSDFPMVGLIKHAATVYTLTLFRDFEKEVKYSMGCMHWIDVQQNAFIRYTVHHENWPDHTAQQVCFDPETNTIFCTCRNFEESGWLCFHALKILYVHSINFIPPQYISKRWTKYAKSEVWKRIENREDNGIEKRKVTPWRYDMARCFYNLVLRCQNNEEAKKALRDSYTITSKHIDNIFAAEKEAQKAAQKAAEEAAQTEESSTNEPQILPHIVVHDPTPAKTKGRSSRKKSHFEIRDTASNKSLEFGTYPVKQQLF